MESIDFFSKKTNEEGYQKIDIVMNVDIDIFENISEDEKYFEKKYFPKNENIQIEINQNEINQNQNEIIINNEKNNEIIIVE
jgi:hypothetical protein